MANYFLLEASSNVKEFVSVREAMKKYELACQMSEFQHLTTDPITVEVDEDSGDIFQDFICDNGVPLISENMKQCFDALKIDYLFYKKVTLTKKFSEVEKQYWLAVPPRINCLNKEKSDIDNYLNYADSIVINPSRVGKYDIFKLAGVTNTEIIITNKLAIVLSVKKFIGIHINKI